MLWSVDESIETMRLADAGGPAEQSELIAEEIWPVSAAELARVVPLDWPDRSAHSTLYGTSRLLPSESVNALPVPLPVAVIEYPRVLVLLQTQTFCDPVTSELGSELAKLKSVRPLIRTRPGTDALMLTEPVDVGPKAPWIEAPAGLAKACASTAPTSREERIDITFTPVTAPDRSKHQRNRHHADLI